MAATEMVWLEENDRTTLQPLMTGKQVPLMVDEVNKLLKTQGKTNYVTRLPTDIQGGDVYIVRPTNQDMANCWKADGKQWKVCGTFHLPRQRKPVVCKRTYTYLLPTGDTSSTIRKDVYVREVGEEDDNVCLVHYLGHFTDDEARSDTELSTELLTSMADGPDLLNSEISNHLPEQMEDMMAETISPATERDVKMLTISTSLESGREPELAADRDAKLLTTSTSLESGRKPELATERDAKLFTTSTILESGREPDLAAASDAKMLTTSTTLESGLETAIRTVKAALEASSKPAPVVDVFNRLMETVVNDPSNTDIEYCLVVKNKKNGESSVLANNDLTLSHTVPAALLEGETNTSTISRPIPSTAGLDNAESTARSDHKRSLRKRSAEKDAADERNTDKSPPPKRSRQSTQKQSTMVKVMEVEMYNGDIMKFPQPRKEVFFSYNIVGDEEKKINRDLFDGKHGTRGKDRYLKMRNYMIEGWTKNKPAHYAVSSALHELSGVGDSKQITRIHAYLECKGVINFSAGDARQPSATPEEEVNAVKGADNNKDIADVQGICKAPTAQTRGRRKIVNSTTRSNTKTQNSKIGKINSDKDSSKQSKVKKSLSKTCSEDAGMPNKCETPDSKKNAIDTSVRSSGRRTRNVSTPNWADIFSGKKRFNKEDRYVTASPAKSANITPKRQKASNKTQHKSYAGSKKDKDESEPDTASGEESVSVEPVKQRRNKNKIESEPDTLIEEESVNVQPAKQRKNKNESEPDTPSGEEGVSVEPVKQRRNKNKIESELDTLIEEESVNVQPAKQRKNKNESEPDTLSGEESVSVEPVKQRKIKGNRTKNKDGKKNVVDKGVSAITNEKNTENTNADSNWEENKQNVKDQPDTESAEDKQSSTTKEELNMLAVSTKDAESLSDLDENASTVQRVNQKMITQSSDNSCETFKEEINSETSGRRTRNRVTYDCLTCKKKFSVKYLLEEHAKTHSLNDSNKSDANELVSTEIGKLTQDKASGDKDVNEDDEEMDEKDLKQVLSIDRDEIIAESDTDYKIEMRKGADISPERQRALRLGRNKRDARTLPGKEKPTCKECGIIFLTEANLRRHSLLHSDKMYECPFCAKIMKRKDYTLTHIRKIHRDVDLALNPIDWDKYTHDIKEINKQNKKNGDINDEHGLNKEQEDNEKTCPLCHQSMASVGELEQHVQKLHGKELKDLVYTCLVCKKHFNTYLEYEVHKTTHKKKSHFCPHCNEVFSSTAKLQVHKRHDHNIQYGTLMYFGYLMNNGRITCEVCSSEFDTMADYHNHRPIHLSLEHLCTECGNGFMSVHELNRHIESKCTYQNLHLPCGVCEQRFTIYDTRRKHLLSFHPKATDFYCHHCGISFEDMETLRKHFPTHKSEKIYECEFCEKQFFEKRNLVDHRELHKSNKTFPCHLCDRLYISAKSLQRHLKIHLGQNKKRCQYCSSLFTTNEELQRHEETHAAEASEMPEDGYSCTICMKKFSSKERLVKHMQVHSEEEEQENSYKCSYCNEEFNVVTMPLWKHMKQVHPEEAKKQKKDLICETCGFTTIHKQRLERHLETHFADKRFVCQVCDKRFQTTSSLLTHMIIHRGKVRKGSNSGYDCSWPECDKLLLKRSYYKKHIISHIFRIKIGKDVCLCKNCNGNTESQSGYILLQEGADGTLQFVENQKIDSKNDGSIANPGTVNVVLTSNGQIQNYESMNVLQEAIAQIEDIEKHSDVVKNADLSEENQGTSESSDETKDVVSSHTETEQVEFTPGLEPNEMFTTPEKTDPGSFVNNLEDATVITMETDTVKDVTEPMMLQQPSQVFNDDGTENLTNLQNEEGNLHPVEDTYKEDVYAENTMDSIAENDEVYDADDIYECGCCVARFPTKCQVLQHFEQYHPNSAFPACEVCAKFFLDQKNLSDHMSIHTGNKAYLCDVCNKNFRTKQCLRQHSFIHADVKPFICSFCGHGFTQRGFFEEHVRRHTGQRPYKCTECSKSFVSKNLLKVHYYSHSGLKPHKCEYCSKTFAEPYQLSTHLRVHNQERPYQCNICEKAFFMKAKVMRHLNTVHNVDKSLLTNFVPTRVRDGIGYRDKTKLKNYVPDAEPRKTQVVYIDSQGNIVSQVMKSAEEIRKEKEGKRIETMAKQQIRPQQPPFMYIKPLEQISMDETSSHSDSLGSFEVFTRRDSSGHIKVDSIVPGSEHMVVENNGSGETIVSIPETDHKQDDIQYEQFQPIENDGSIDLDGQNYTFVSAEGQSVENHLELITHALQAQGDNEQGTIQVVTEDIPGSEQVRTDADGNIEIYTDMEEQEVEGSGEQENFSINIGEDGSVDPADFEKIEALRNLYCDQPIVIVVEQQQQE